MTVMNSRIENAVKCNFGGGNGSAATPPPPPPTRNQAADGPRDTGTTKRRGYTSTILGGRATSTTSETNPLKTLLGS